MQDGRPKGPVRCIDCINAKLIQYDKNPILAECSKKPQPGNVRFPYEISIASSVRMCQMHRHQDVSDKTVEHRTHHEVSV